MPRFSMPSLSIRHRLPLLIGLLLLGIITASTLASYRGVREAAFQVGRERLENLTQQLANSSQQSTVLLLNKTFAAANDPAIRAFLQSPSPSTRASASAVLQPFNVTHDPNSLRVELWRSDNTLALIVPDDISTATTDLNAEFTQCALEPFRAAGELRIINDVIVYPALAAAKDEAGKTIGYLVRWRRPSTNSDPRALKDLLGIEAALYFGNSRGDFWADTAKTVPLPPSGLSSTLQVAHYKRDGNSVMALGRPIKGTPFFLVVEFPEHSILSGANNFLRRLLIIDFFLLAFGLLGALMLSRSITRPLSLLTGSASGISNGNYSGIVNIRRNDELGALGDAFNSMVAGVRESQRRLEQTIKELKVVQETASKLAAIVESSQDAIIGKTLDGIITSWNKSSEGLYGYAADEVLGKSIAVLLSPQLAAEIATLLERVGRGESIDHFETERLTKEGKRLAISLTISPIRDASGVIIGSSTIARDITTRKQAEEALRASEIRYRRLFESAKDGILILEADTGRIIDVNPYLLELLGSTKEKLMGQELWELGCFPDIVDSKTAFIELQECGYVRYEDLPLEDNEGTLRQVEFVSNSYLAGENRVIQCNVRDISERKLEEAATRANEARYRTLFEYAPAGIVIADPNSYYVDANASICRMLGYTRDELIGLHASDIVAETEFQHIGSTLRELHGKHDHNREWKFRRKDNSFFAAEVIATMMPDGNLLGIVHDITERKAAEEDLRHTNESLAGTVAELLNKTEELAATTQQLWQSSKLATMGELAASVAHELNNPLATLALHAESLLDQLPDGDPNRRPLEVIAQEVERMASLVSNLLLFSRRNHRQISSVDLCEEIVNSLDFVQYHLRSHKIDIVQDCADNLPTVQADQQQLRQVFLNLITNASDAMPEGGTLTVRSRAGVMAGGQPAVVVEFSDTGTGIKTADLPKLWEPFFTTKPEGKGTGLGLGICRRTVEEHRGTIEIETEPAGGTTVRITLPATDLSIEVAA